MHHIFLGRRLDILIAHRLYGLLLRFKLILEYFKFHPILGNLGLFFIEITAQFTHLIFDPFLVCLEKADFF